MLSLEDKESMLQNIPIQEPGIVSISKILENSADAQF